MNPEFKDLQKKIASLIKPMSDHHDIIELFESVVEQVTGLQVIYEIIEVGYRKDYD